MATSQTDNKDVPTDTSDIKRKLAWRMGFAGLLIVALLGGLALFDYLGEQDTEPSAPQFTEPVPVAKKAATLPLMPAEPVPEVTLDGNNVSVPESTAPPVDNAAPAAEPPPRPEIAAQPVLPPARRAAADAGPSASLAPGQPVESRAAAPVVTPTRLFAGYALQAGVFADPRRAEELHARLVLAGIPATIEARVQAGPFKSKAEAKAAREKMKALGIETVMLAPKASRR